MSLKKTILFTFSFLACFEFSSGQSDSFYDPVLKKEIFTVADYKPSFPGGNEALMDFFKQHIKYPKEAKENALETTLWIKIVVDSDGSIFSPEIENGIVEFGFAEEAF